MLTTLLSEDINNLNGLTTEYLATLLSVFLSIIAGLAVAFYFCWQQAIVCVLSMPLMLLGGYLMQKIRPKNMVVARKTKADPYEESNALLTDVIMNYRTIMSFGENNIDVIIDKYQGMLQGPE